MSEAATETGIALFVLLLGGYALIANRLDQASIGPAVFFVLAGLLLGPDVLGVLHIDIESSTIRQLAELTLALVLFTDASTIDLDMPQEWMDPVIWLLADDLETEYPVNDARLAGKIERKAQEAKQILDYWDTEGTSLFMQPDL